MARDAGKIYDAPGSGRVWPRGSGYGPKKFRGEASTFAAH